MHYKRVYWLLPALLLGVLGCGQAGNKTYPVTGTVRYQGKPLPLGIVMFVPNAGPSSKPAAIDPQGRYRVEAAAGDYRVAIVAVPPREGGRPDPTREGGFDYTGVPEAKPLIPAKYSRHATSGITVTVEPGGKAELDIHLE
ncbi:MAG: hypothetical protein U1E05_04910 [Patescibacteria group bacterium]|nr:hypothetical protein [Patescibacteria group bacterium]